MGWFLIAAGILTLALLGYSETQRDVSLASFQAAATALVMGAGFVVPAAPSGWELVSRALRQIAVVLGIATVVLTFATFV
jgi:hypothetical protein